MKQKTYAFSKKALLTSTPMWANWVFRIFFLLSSAAEIIIAGEPGIDDQMKIRLGVYLAAANVVVWGFSKMFGVEPSDEIVDEQEEFEKKENL